MLSYSITWCNQKYRNIGATESTGSSKRTAVLNGDAIYGTKQFDGLSDIKLDLYEKDVPFINGKIDEIIKKVADVVIMAETHLISAIQRDIENLENWKLLWGMKCNKYKAKS